MTRRPIVWITIAEALIALPCRGQEIGRELVAIVDTKIQAKGRESVDLEMGSSIVPDAIQGDWIGAGSGWVQPHAEGTPSFAARLAKDLDMPVRAYTHYVRLDPTRINLAFTEIFRVKVKGYEYKADPFEK